MIIKRLLELSTPHNRAIRNTWCWRRRIFFIKVIILTNSIIIYKHGVTITIALVTNPPLQVKKAFPPICQLLMHEHFVLIYLLIQGNIPPASPSKFSQCVPETLRFQEF